VKKTDGKAYVDLALQKNAGAETEKSGGMYARSCRPS
jgi:hypothetical protein